MEWLSFEYSNMAIFLWLSKIPHLTSKDQWINSCCVEQCVCERSCLQGLDLNFEQYILRLTEMTPNFCVQQKRFEWSLSSKNCQIMCKNMQHNGQAFEDSLRVYTSAECVTPQTFYNIHAVHRSLCLRKGPIYVYVYYVCATKKLTMHGYVFK